MVRSSKTIGIDFDNTLIFYHRAFYCAALAQNLISADCIEDKTTIRDCIRKLPEGEQKWQALQGQVYAHHLFDADLASGAEMAIRKLREQDCALYIVSHKTKYGHFDPEKRSLHEAALEWMSAQGFFESSRFGFQPEDVSFHPTRAEKIRRIAQLDCTFFIDDLMEVLSDHDFPTETKRVLLSSTAVHDPLHDIVVCESWEQVLQQIELGL